MNWKKAVLALSFVLLLTLTSVMVQTVPVNAEEMRGPKIDRLRLKVIRSPDAQYLAMIARDIDVLTKLVSPRDVEELSNLYGKNVTCSDGFQFCHFGFNLRPTLIAGPEAGEKNPLHDVNFRHALAHLMPKDRIIATMFEYICVKLDSMVPPTMSEWYNPYVDDHPFSDPETLGEDCESVYILKAAGYTPVGDWPYSSWLDPEGDPLTPIRVYVPLRAVAPTSHDIGEKWVEQMHAIGLNNVILSPEELCPYLIKTYNEWDFEIYWAGWNVGESPEYLYGMCHSSENYLESSNPHGIYWPALDEQLELLKYGLDNEEKVAACKEAQALIAGGTPWNPLPYNCSTTDNNLNWSIPQLPVYHRTSFDAQQPELEGAASLDGSSIDNMWTFMRMNWSVDPSTIDRVDPDGKAFIIWCVGDYPEMLNPLACMHATSYAWDFMSPIYDSLTIPNMYTWWNMPWLATDWEIVNSTQAPLPDGVETAVKFWLRDDAYWHDGTPFTSEDVAFSWLFLRDWQIPKTWTWAQHIVDVVANPVDNSVVCYLDTTSDWIIPELSGWGAVLPPTVWEKNPITGENWTDLTEILSFDPAQEWVSGPLPTYLYGTGPYIFQFYDLVMGYGDLDANRDYWLTQVEIEQKIPEQFHAAGDVYDGIEEGLPRFRPVISIWDLARIAASFGVPESLYVNGFDNNKTGWTRVGDPPYLNATGDDSYIYESTESSSIGDFDFEDKAGYKPEPYNVILQLSCRQDFCNKSDIDVYIYDGIDWHLAGTIYPRATLRWMSINVTHILNTKAKVNAAKMYLHKSGTGPECQNVYVGCARLQYLDKADPGPPPVPQANLYADICGAMRAPPDNKIDIDDLVICAIHFGKPWTEPAIYSRAYREIPEITAW